MPAPQPLYAETRLSVVGDSRAAFLMIPHAVILALNPPDPKRVSISGWLHGVPFTRKPLVPKPGGVYSFYIQRPLWKQLQVPIGAEVALRLKLEPWEVPVPEDLAEGLAVSPPAAAFFRGLSAQQRRYYCEWVTAAAHPETRMQRVVTAVLRLEAGKRFQEK